MAVRNRKKEQKKSYKGYIDKISYLYFDKGDLPPPQHETRVPNCIVLIVLYVDHRDKSTLKRGGGVEEDDLWN